MTGNNFGRMIFGFTGRDKGFMIRDTGFYDYMICNLINIFALFWKLRNQIPCCHFGEIIFTKDHSDFLKSALLQTILSNLEMKSWI